MHIDQVDVGLLPPLLTVSFGVFFFLLSFARRRENSINILFTFLCVLTSVRPAQYLFQRVVTDTGMLMQIEKVILVAYAFLPFVGILFLHNVLKVRKPLLEKCVLGCSLVMAAASMGPWFLSGVHTYEWGVIGKAGPLFPLYVLNSIVCFGYVLYTIFTAVKSEQNPEVRLKQYYLFAPLLGGVVLLLVTGLAFTGIHLYPASNFMFVPMAVMAYGSLRHRILDVGSIVHLVLYKLAYAAVLLIPNIIVFHLMMPLLLEMAFLPLIPLLFVWYWLNYFYAMRVHPVVSRRFNRYQHRLRTAEGKFARDLLILRDTRSLVAEFGELVRSTLRFGSIRFFFVPSDGAGCLTDMDGDVINLDEGTTAWLVAWDRLIDRYHLESDRIMPSQGVRQDLMDLLGAYKGICGVPLVQHDQLIGLVVFADKQGGAPVTPMEILFLEKVSRYLSIALYNSRVYQAVTSLKDQLELRRRELSREILERRRAEEKFRESEVRYKLLADNILDTFVVVGVESKTIQYASPSCQILTGYSAEEIVGASFRDFLTESTRRELGKVVPSPQEGGSFMAELEQRRKDGRTSWMEVSGHFIDTGAGGMEVVGLARDISERRDAELEKEELHQKLRQAQKMESIGVLAGGIAHDFNNILMAILGYTQLGAMYLGEKDGEAAGVVAQIEKACIRAKELVSQILAFSRQNEQTRHAVDLAAITQEALSLMRPTIPSDVAIYSDFSEEPAMVVADPVQVHQIVVNLCTNASHALEERGGGSIHVRVQRTTLDAGEARRYGVEPGPFVALRVSDTGSGMDEEVRCRIFEPYFTTKGDGKGTGMGLAVVHGIILSHNGAVVVESRKERGSTFHVYLPEAEWVPEVRARDSEGDKVGGGRILFVDDEAMLVNLSEETLLRMGFEVVAKDNPEDALACFTENPEGFDVVVTDMTMPRMSGLKLAEQLRAINPDIPVILCTGFSNDLVGRRHEDMGVSAVLFKPVPMKELAEVIRRTLVGKTGVVPGGEVA